MERVPLNNEQRAIVRDVDDISFIEFINGINFDEMREYSDSIYVLDKYFEDYMNLQQQWLNTEEYLIRNRPGHSLEVCCEELLNDIFYYKNNLRFRIFYALKFPERVRCERELLSLFQNSLNSPYSRSR